MEKALLQEMIRDREISIQFLEKKLEIYNDRANRLRQDQEEMVESKKTKREEHRAELMKLWKDYDGLLCRYQDARDALDTKKLQPQKKGKGGAAAGAGAQQGQEPPGQFLEVYHEIMLDVVIAADKDPLANGGADPNNQVVRMQAQLCKAMHGMGIMETQRQLTKGQVEQIQKKAKDVVPEMIEAKSHVELKMVNDLIFADNSKREIESKRNVQHETFSKERNDLMDKIERQIDEAINNENNGDNAENDLEEEEAKEELQGILQEGREEMERLEKLIKDKEAKVEELKISAAMAQGQDVVDDIVTSIAEEFADGDGSGDDDSATGSY
mmetsp:Transcript_20720/g.48758  ORF Transcript_20720/g.48758 Transcript_20720/m.48758 type:complete len:327 (-) Transcript_20720:426-1406(-)